MPFLQSGRFLARHHTVLSGIGRVPLAAHHPGRCAGLVHVFEDLPVLEGVHRRLEPVIGVRRQFSLADQPLEWLLDQLLARMQVIEDGVLEDEESAVDEGGVLATCPMDVTMPRSSCCTRWNVLVGRTATNFATASLAWYVSMIVGSGRSPTLSA